MRFEALRWREAVPVDRIDFYHHLWECLQGRPAATDEDYCGSKRQLKLPMHQGNWRLK